MLVVCISVLQLDWKENGVDMNTSALMLQPSGKTDEMMINFFSFSSSVQ